MEHDIDQFGRELMRRLKWLIAEVKRLSDENERLLRENKELREEVTLARLQGELGGSGDLLDELASEVPVEPVLSPEAMQFYRILPEKINFSDFFRYAEAGDISVAEARDYLLAFIRQGLVEQRGRLLEKAVHPSGNRSTTRREVHKG
ncbi:MAG: hypothetical protein WD423_07225 [Rhodothermales bacterium]